MQDLVFFYPDNHAAHAEIGHPERPERVETIRQALTNVGWWEKYPHVKPETPSIEVLSAIHNMDYIRRLEDACSQGHHLDMDTFTTIESWQLALNAAGGAIAVADAVWERRSTRGFALCRPPGHHATPNQGMGFCLLNNVALAAEYLQQTYNVHKLAIIDLDLHHGNGTQEIFWRRGDVLYISTHQSPYYPGTGQLTETGSGDGEGSTANFPIPPMTGDIGFTNIMEQGILPILNGFSPEILLVSYGFDTHWRDPLGNLLLTAKGYGSLISSLVKWSDINCNGRILLVLEGGYDLEAAAACGIGVTAALLGEEFEDPLGPAPFQERKDWYSILIKAKEIWSI